MKIITRIVAAAVFCVIIAASASLARDAAPGESGRSRDPAQAFYNANALYEKGEYDKAIDDYMSIVDGGLESGALYYNLGNSFLKLNKVGYAVYWYEKARRLIPRDSDLKANLDYARTLAGTVEYPEPILRVILKRFFYPIRQMSLNSAAVLAASVYVLVVIVSVFFIRNRILLKRYGFVLYVLIVLAAYSALASGLKYYHEHVMRFGIAVEKGTECKYEPIDKSTTYFILPEGEKAVIIKTRGDWKQVRRLDGKTGWVKSELVREI